LSFHLANSATGPVSAKAAAEKSGSSPRWIIVRRAMLLSSPRLDFGGRFTVAVGPVWPRRGDIDDHGGRGQSKGDRMPQTPHVETHFTSSARIRDIVIGMSEGLTVPFALAAGLSGVVDSTGLVITAGLAEVAAGAIAMGLGGYLAARTDAEHYDSEYAREEGETFKVPEVEIEEVASIFRAYGLPETTVASVAQAIGSDRRRWVEFMMKFELGVDKPDPARARVSASTIALAYVAGGLVPLAPYFVLRSTGTALVVSILTTLLALLVFGYVKGTFTVKKPLRSAWQTAVVGGLAAAAAFGIAKLIT
jgi:vacuolar iron transporter family protein